MNDFLGNTSPTQERVLDLSLLTTVEKKRLLKEWNNTQAVYPQNLCLHQLFEEQVKKTPHNIAISFENQKLTYHELNQRANQVAHYLQKANIKPETMVGICLERSLNLIIGILGILKAGGSYVPLDPAYPYDRLAFMLLDLQLPILITESACLNRLPKCQARTILIDTDGQTIAQESNLNLQNRVTAQNLAYTIYTVNTDKPKGVQITHQAVINFLYSMRQKPGMTELDIMLATTTICFSIAGLEIYLPLIVGAQIALISREAAADPRQLAHSITSSGATIMQATLATWRMLLSYGWQGNKQLKILCGGEALSRGLANQLLAKVGSVWNMYGATEATIWSAVWQVQPGTGPILIGKAIANTQFYIIDHLLRRKSDPIKPLPINAIGELCIGGDGLARGYYNRPESDRKKFIPNVFDRELNSRLYKTGDLARYLPDGNIELIGRAGNQVNIRGFRVELKDVESALLEHYAVKEAVVVAREDLAGDKSLIAYLVIDIQFLQSSPTQDCTKSHTIRTLQWQEIWNVAYTQPIINHDPTFNINGLNNSYTGQLMTVPEIRAWIDRTVKRILALKPKRLIEIGCGTGLLMFRIAPYCDFYFGTDISARAIAYLEQQWQNHQVDCAQIKLATKDAMAALTGVESASVDTVVLNSVVQYFPSIDYLVQVLEKAVQVVQPGGKIFIGDIRSLPLLAAFHTSVQMEKSPSNLSTLQLQQKIQEQIAQDPQLAIDPTFFTVLRQHLPQIGAVEIQLKSGQHHNEFTRFRYDVILHIEPQVKPTVEILWQDWKPELTISSIRQTLQQAEPAILGIKQIPNPRLLTEVQAIKLLEDSKAPTTVGELKAAIELANFDMASIDPEEIWNLSYELPYKIYIQESSYGDRYSYDAVFHRLSSDRQLVESIPAFDYPTSAIQPWSAYANHPGTKEATNALILQLRSFLKQDLPEYTIPSAFVVLDALPLTLNGKIDRRALPAPNELRPALTQEFAAPTTGIEEQLAQIWMEILQIEPIGIHDNFFDLGGYSLLSINLLAQIREVFQVDLPLQYLFKNATIAKLAQAIEVAQSSGVGPAVETQEIALDLNAETVLDPAICPGFMVNEFNNCPQQIFLTGATGFLGAFLLEQLLKETEADIHCLVRAGNVEEGRQNISNNLERYLIDPQFSLARIIPVLGDLSKPFFGLHEQQFQQLASVVDVIYHGGANVDLSCSYSEMKATNVIGTQEVLRLASHIKIKPVHFLSTFDVFPPSMHPEKIQENDELEQYAGLNTGYAQSKWVAEKLIMTARLRGLPVCIYRLGTISGHSKTGAAKTNDWAYGIIKSLIQLESAPDLDVQISLTPVDYISQAIVYLSKQESSIGKAFHLINSQPLPLSKFVAKINTFGYPVKQIAYDRWQGQLFNCDVSSDLMASIFTKTVAQSQLTGIERSSMVLQVLDCQNTLTGLKDSAIDCPSIEVQLLTTYLLALTRNRSLRATPPSNLGDRETNRQTSNSLV